MSRLMNCSLLLLLFLLPMLAAAVQTARLTQSSTESPAVIKAVAPVFPVLAAAARVGGDVEIEVKLNSRGRVTEAHALSGHQMLRKSAEGAARLWEFESQANTNGARVVRLTFSFEFFHVDDREADPAELTPIFFPPYKIEVKHNVLK